MKDDVGHIRLECHVISQDIRAMDHSSTHMIESGVHRAGRPSLKMKVTSLESLSTRTLIDLENWNGLSQKTEISKARTLARGVSTTDK